MATSSPKLSCRPFKWFTNRRLKPSLPRIYLKYGFSTPSSPSTANITPKSRKRREELLKVFQQLDIDGDGKISGEELADYFASIGLRAFEIFKAQDIDGCITPRGLQKCETMIRAFDLDGNGVLDFDEFHQMMSGIW
ncbi:hypothetical protein K2173_027864 [Erythroxylum novogranatense]|uniref:EF-hand domain-containing protein n=1 Tax=Erythroxylum novogranatense TaxID=1862640 RepID=A0AAV8U055_9ROSI|nr:hypothetical protein K2173_027864 [Erythroxylum novogranatense]